ncbi:MAG: hypothetical protein P8J13_07600 [Gammaproteobacteria bacterium]|jgi:hypothetical protein|nr:hypothetical protein [Gammaproteobacteria bacterium]
MKWLKSTSIILLAMTLAACGHGFEGEYQSEAGSSIELMDVFAEVAGSQKFVIGKNFIDSQGNRTEFEEIFVRESGSDRYLVFKISVNEEDVWKIIDDNTLMKGNDLMSLKLVRIINK